MEMGQILLIQGRDSARLANSSAARSEISLHSIRCACPGPGGGQIPLGSPYAGLPNKWSCWKFQCHRRMVAGSVYCVRSVNGRPPIVLPEFPAERFSEPSVRSEIADTDIPFVIPANDNVPAKGWLSAKCRTLFLRLIGMIA